jgi:hypothetical protein
VNAGEEIIIPKKMHFTMKFFTFQKIKTDIIELQLP